MAHLLHIDTSTDRGMVAIGGDGQLLAYRVNPDQRNHAAAVNLMIDELLAEVGITMQQLSAVVVCAGPGSYTGLRVGMATAKGVCYALDKPLIADNRLTLLAHQAYKQHGSTYAQYAVLLSAREKEYFISVYDNHFISALQPQHMMETDLPEMLQNENTYVITDVPEEKINAIFANITPDFCTEIDVNVWISYSFDKYNCNDIVNLANAEPFYLKQVYTHK